MLRFTHQPPQFVLGEVQLPDDWQRPATHAWPIPQRLPSVPQLLGDAWRSVQRPPVICVRPARHTQRLAEHI